VVNPATASDGNGIELREELSAGTSTQVRIELKAQGLYRPALPAGAGGQESRMPKPLELDVQTRLAFNERVVAAGAGGSGTRIRAVRWVSQAASAINGEIRPTAGSLRPELSILIAERDEGSETVTVVSPAGPLMRSELELVQGLGDPLLLCDLLPGKPVAKGHSWKPSRSAAMAISGYDALKSSWLEAKLENIDESLARVLLKGEIQGSVLGGAGTIGCEGFFTYDRRAGLINRLELNRSEKRDAGPVEAGLDVRSTLTVTRRQAPVIPELADTELAKVSLEISPQRQLLEFASSDGKYSLLHDRHWHTYWDDRRLTVLKRLDHGQAVAQCNLALGPTAGKGRHQDVSQFRDDVRRSLKQRFVQFLGAGEVDGDPAGGFRYKLGVQGREGDLGVLWYYFLVASPGGDQLLATFTLAEEDAKTFGDQDLQIIGSLQWGSPALKKSP
jgi:hypothetical protein